VRDCLLAQGETGSKEKDDGYQENCEEGGEESCKEGCSEEGGEESLQKDRICWIGHRPRPLRLGGIELLWQNVSYSRAIPVFAKDSQRQDPMGHTEKSKKPESEDPSSGPRPEKPPEQEPEEQRPERGQDESRAPEAGIGPGR
jgi:hypothetical protein